MKPDLDRLIRFGDLKWVFVVIVLSVPLWYLIYLFARETFALWPLIKQVF